MGSLRSVAGEEPEGAGAQLGVGGCGRGSWNRGPSKGQRGLGDGLGGLQGVTGGPTQPQPCSVPPNCKTATEPLRERSPKKPPRERSHFSSSPLWSSPKKAQHLPLTMFTRSRSPTATGCSGAEHPAPWGRSPSAGHPGATGRQPPLPAPHHQGRERVEKSSWLFSTGFLTQVLVSPDLSRLRDLTGDASGGDGASSCSGLCCAPRPARHSPWPGALAPALPLQERSFLFFFPPDCFLSFS